MEFTVAYQVVNWTWSDWRQRGHGRAGDISSTTSRHPRSREHERGRERHEEREGHERRPEAAVVTWKSKAATGESSALCHLMCDLLVDGGACLNVRFKPFNSRASFKNKSLNTR
ncbi:hypothetical protein M758_11G157900 [Ceratodon purpureus]|nr:hypothetical protein M758_11G157900 [Ceratodon purpureus]